MKPSSRSLLCEWMKTAWNSIHGETIRNSFLSCAITTNTNGDEDNQIHCFKIGQPCEAGLSDLLKEMGKKQQYNKTLKTHLLVVRMKRKKKRMKHLLTVMMTQIMTVSLLMNSDFLIVVLPEIEHNYIMQN